MLTELAKYAEDHNLESRPGFKGRTVKAYVCLSSTGQFLGIEPRDKGAPPIYAPDIGSMANAPKTSNVVIEKAKIPLCIVKDPIKDVNIPATHDNYISMLDDGKESEPKFGTIIRALHTTETRDAILDALAQNKITGELPISFKVDGVPVEQTAACADWWVEYRKRFAKPYAGKMPHCLITGKLTIPLASVPKVSGLMSVGGHSSGDAFLCFDKSAFCSYGFKQSANAPVSEEAMVAVNAALTKLINDAETFCGTKLVHWYSGEVADDTDIFGDLLGGDWYCGDNTESVEDNNEAERAALSNAKRLIKSIKAGERPPALSARYYIMPISGAGGRMMVRGWYEGSFEELYHNIDQWFDDLRLISNSGRGTTRPPKLKAVCIRLLKYGGDPKKILSRLDSEIPNLAGRLLQAIINGNPLPDAVATRALLHIRSKMLSGTDEESDNSIYKESIAFQLLKAWLIRYYKQKGDEKTMGIDCNTSTHTVAYCCGRLLAVYSKIQVEGNPDVNVGFAERYYAAASTSPALIIGRLAQLSQYYLPKIKEKKNAYYYQRVLGEIFTEIGDNKIPTTMTQVQQAEFALGYYQQRAILYPKKKKKAAVGETENERADENEDENNIKQEDNT